MKRKIVVMLIAAMLTTSLAACSSTDSASEAASADASGGASVSASADAMADMPADASGDPMGGPGGPGGPGGGPPGMGAGINMDGVISIASGDATVDAGYDVDITKDGDTVVIDGLEMTDGDYSFTGINTSNSDLVVKNARIELNTDSPADSEMKSGTAIYTDSGTTRIEDSDILVNGAGRHTIATEQTGKVVVSGSSILSGGDLGANGNSSEISEPPSNEALTISGRARSNFSVGATQTFYYNSLCVAEGWAALSTDSAVGDGLEFVGYNTEAVAEHGGYDIYADTNCRDYIYGMDFVSAEVGAIISNNGLIETGSTTDAMSATTLSGIEAMSESGEEAALEDEIRTVIRAGRNDFQLHSPDMFGEGNSDYKAQVYLKNTDLITDDSINGDGYAFTSDVNGETYLIQATKDYYDYGDAFGKYVDYVKGAAILLKSTSADITLDNVTVDSFSGVALLSAVNSDGMSRFLKEDCGKGVDVTVTNSTIDGSFVHDDYQRDMRIIFDGSVLNGAVTYSDKAAWDEMWKEVGDDEKCVWYNLDASAYITDTHATELTLANGAVWNVTADSQLTKLVVSEDATVNGQIEAESTQTAEDGSTVYINAVVTAQ